MQMLEARFFPIHEPRGTYIVVGHVVWDQEGTPDRPRIEPAPSLRDAPSPAAILSTLRYLVLRAAPATMERLGSLRGTWWTFVPVERRDKDGGILSDGPVG